MPGVQVFTYANIGKETVRGTPVAPTRQLYVDGTGVLKFDNAQNTHAGENSGVRTRIRRVTRASEDVSLKLGWDAISWDDLVVFASQLQGGLTGVGGGADKTWTLTPGMTGTNNPESYSLDVGDDVQNWRVQYAMLTSWKLSAAIGELTKADATAFGQRAVKTVKASPALNSAPKIPGDLWTVKYAATQAGLAGASIQTNHLVGWELEVMTGIRWRHYMDGNLYGAQHVETDMSAKLTLTVESTALAVSEFYDKHVSDTMDFVRLKATGTALGASNYSAQLDLPVFYGEPEVIGSEDEGINLYKIPANLAYDGTGAKSIQGVLVNSLAALP